MLDAVGSLLSGGRATHQIDGTVWAAGQVSQVFIAIDVQGSRSSGLEGIEGIVRDLHAAQPAGPSFSPTLCCAPLPAHNISCWHTVETLVQSEHQGKGCTEQEWQTTRQEAWQLTQLSGTQSSNFGDLHNIMHILCLLRRMHRVRAGVVGQFVIRCTVGARQYLGTVVGPYASLAHTHIIFIMIQ